MTALDPRLRTAGLAVSVETLVAVFADHWRGIPAATVCRTCGYRLPDTDDRAECPTNRLVRPMLHRRRNENPSALHALTPDQRADLKARHPSALAYQQPTYQPATNGLFDINPVRRTGGLR
jgi:hypothetical protein